MKNKTSDRILFTPSYYPPKLLSPETLGLLYAEPFTWKDKLASAWDTFKQICLIATVFMCWSFSMAMMFRLVGCAP